MEERMEREKKRSHAVTEEAGSSVAHLPLASLPAVQIQNGSEETRKGGRGAGGGKSEGDSTTEGRSRAGEEEDGTVEKRPSSSREREDGNE